MLTDTKLRSQVDQLWEKLWTGGLNNPMDAIEQFSYLLFFKRLDDEEDQRERQAQRRNQPFEPKLPEAMRWRYWTQLEAAKALAHVRNEIFPWFRNLGDAGSSFERYMATAEFKINRAGLLIEACRTIDQMQISAQNHDVQGDLYEYLLSYLSVAGRNGQFRTPRHIIRLMVQMMDPKPHERIGDLAAGTCGFLVNAYQYILEQHTSPDILEYDSEGMPHNLVGDRLTEGERELLQQQAFRGYDNDSGMTMLRIGSMNLMLHGLGHPRFYYMDTLSKEFSEISDYDLILMNPPFKGAVDGDEVHGDLPSNTTKSELLFLHQILRALEMGGRCAVIVPDGVLFGSTTAHKEIRKTLIEENRLDGVVSMPGGVFKPYAGVSTAILLFTKGATTDKSIWFYDMAHDGFSLDDKRQPTVANDIPDIRTCWQQRHDPDFQAARQATLERLKTKTAPLKAERLRQEKEINRLTFESAIAPESATPGDEHPASKLESAKSTLAELNAAIAPIQAQIDQLTNHFWVEKSAIVKSGYDLSASRYRQVQQDAVFYEQPAVTMGRLLRLEKLMNDEILQLQGMSV